MTRHSHPLMAWASQDDRSPGLTLYICQSSLGRLLVWRCRLHRCGVRELAEAAQRLGGLAFTKLGRAYATSYLRSGATSGYKLATAGGT